MCVGVGQEPDLSAAACGLAALSSHPHPRQGADLRATATDSPLQDKASPVAILVPREAGSWRMGGANLDASHTSHHFLLTVPPGLVISHLGLSVLICKVKGNISSCLWGSFHNQVGSAVQPSVPRQAQNRQSAVGDCLGEK